MLTPDPMLPNLIIIGAQQCGTTSLHYYLDSHPSIAMSRRKELNFFLDSSYDSKTVTWYASRFDSSKPVRGESSPNYTCYPINGNVPERMHSVIPEARLIYLVRPPIDRIVSQYMLQRSRRKEFRTFERALDSLDRGEYLAHSRYATQLEQFLSFYPMSQILVITQDELRNDRLNTLRRVFEFVGVDSSFECIRFSRELHRSRDRRLKNRLGDVFAKWAGNRIRESLRYDKRYEFDRFVYRYFSVPLPRPEVPETLRCRLAEELRLEMRRLESLTGRQFDGWL
jgi:hypothetical protein